MQQIVKKLFVNIMFLLVTFISTFSETFKDCKPQFSISK